jgi:polar amino acid transport system permease protein
MTFNMSYALHILPQLIGGAGVSLILTIAGMGVALLLALPLALVRLSTVRPLAALADFIFYFVRGTPLLIQLFFLFYVLPFAGIQFPAFLTGVGALGIYESAYLSEIYRTGILAVPKHQWEAATALNLTPGRTWSRVILPQAIPPMLPAIGSQMIMAFKESAIVSTITVQELLNTALTEANSTFRYTEPLLLAGFIYFVLSYSGSLLVRVLEKRYAVTGR